MKFTEEQKAYNEKMRLKIVDNSLTTEVKESRIDLKKKLPIQPMILSCGSDWEGKPNCVMGIGDYSVITGKSKSKKTFFKSMVIASYIAGNETDDMMPFTTHRKGNKIILDIDTEQSDYHTQRAGQRINRIIDGDYDNYFCYGWQLHEPKERRVMLQNLIETYKYDIGLIVLDGYIDFVEDFNDKVECFAFQKQIMAWSKQYSFHISGVLHKNPNGEKMIGHLGSVMERKASTIISLERNVNDKHKSLVVHERARDMEFDDFAMEINRGLPYKTNI